MPERVELRYFRRPSESEAKENTPEAGFECDFCKKKKYRTGGIRDAYSAFPKMICRDCAIAQFAKENKCDSLEEAEIMRDRIFDVNYKINESIYERMCHMEDIDPRVEDEDVMKKATLLGNTFWNALDKEFKEELESVREVRFIEFMAHDLAEDALDEFLDFAEEEEDRLRKRR